MGDAAQITCLNQNCQAPNPETHRFCQQCRTPLPKRYLWAVGEGIETYKPGKVLAGRFSIKNERILLDTKPGLPLSYTEDVSDRIVPYLRLFPYQLHIPQVYGKLPPLKKGKNKEIWLLEQAPILVEKNPKTGKSPSPVLMPELTAVWQDAGPMRQLNWLWQIAQLWQPLCIEGVGASLLNPKLLRVEGQLVRLLELRLFPESQPTLSQLGQLWRQLVTGANPAIADFLQQLCQQMIQEQLSNSDELVAQLDLALQAIGRSQSRSYQVVTLTDTGPTRQRNEDACYPPPLSSPQEQKSTGLREKAKSASTQNLNPTPTEALCIVCDGIGGHDGGNVASNIAIKTVQQQLQQLSGKEISQSDLIAQLEYSICEANDRISQRNDVEGRAERQRMGTTIVMAKAYAHEVYIAHIGDSRAYWITRTGCHQVTLDDDVASREVRLGYAIYREALQQIGAGSLVQALGMSFSSNLHPSLQRFAIDEDSIFLLCSDGLSDNDLVEQYWETEILPVLDKKIDLATAAAKLVEIANTQNGHDNVTVGLVYSQVRDNSPDGKLKQMTWLNPPVKQPTSSKPSSLPDESLDKTVLPGQYSQMKTPLLVPTSPRPRLLPLLAAIVVLLGLGGVLAYIWVPSIGRRVDSLLGINSSRRPQSQQPSSPSTPRSVDRNSTPALTPGSQTFSQGELILITIPAANNSQETVTLRLRAGSKAPESQRAIGIIPKDSVLQIQNKALIGQESWLFLKVCTIPQSEGTQGQAPGTVQSIAGEQKKTANTPSPNSSVKPGQVGWIKQAEIEPLIQPNSILEPAFRGECSPKSGLVAPLSEKKHLSP